MLKKIFRSAVVPMPKLFNCKKVLFVGPHPDDIEIGCGGTVAELVARGIEVVFVICADDRYSVLEDDYDIEELKTLRANEAIASAKVLGVTDVRFLGYADGGLYPIEDLTRDLALQYADIGADIIFIPDPHMRDEFHLDHIKVGYAGCAALFTGGRLRQVRDMGGHGFSDHIAAALYYTSKPNYYVKISKQSMEKKLEATYCHESQMFGDEKRLITLYTKFRAIRFGLRRCCRYAEGYRMLARSFHHVVTEWCD